jgi:hypothetical protein
MDIGKKRTPIVVTKSVLHEAHINVGWVRRFLRNPPSCADRHSFKKGCVLRTLGGFKNTNPPYIDTGFVVSDYVIV